jgi:hypothetical protein
VPALLKLEMPPLCVPAELPESLLLSTIRVH